jgi:hypothetical protein
MHGKSIPAPSYTPAQSLLLAVNTLHGKSIPAPSYTPAQSLLLAVNTLHGKSILAPPYTPQSLLHVVRSLHDSSISSTNCHAVTIYSSYNEHKPQKTIIIIIQKIFFMFLCSDFEQKFDAFSVLGEYLRQMILTIADK